MQYVNLTGFCITNSGRIFAPDLGPHKGVSVFLYRSFWGGQNSEMTNENSNTQPEYVPAQFASRRLPEINKLGFASLTTAAIARRLKVIRCTGKDLNMYLWIEGLDATLRISQRHMMVFGDIEFSALDYFRMVIEDGDHIDAVVGPFDGEAYSVECFWIRIVYQGSVEEAGSFSRKEDGMFAFRTKAGEKAERVTARILHRDFGHSFAQAMFDTPGHFVIRLDKNKKVRKPDRKCLICGLEFEMKKRNRDRRFRVSHSAGRPFCEENRSDGWHAFVFPDMKPRFVPNSKIADAIKQNRFQQGKDGYDAWAEMPEAEAWVCDPPRCHVVPEKESLGAQPFL